MRRKSAAQLDQDVAAYLYWPGGSGGGGSQKRTDGATVVRSHARTSPSCRRCGQLHTIDEHEDHNVEADTRVPQTNRPRKTPTPKTMPKAKNTPKTKAVKTTPRPTLHTSMPAWLSPVAVVRKAISALKGRARFGRKVFISALWDRVGDKIGMSLPEFKAWLLEQNRIGTLELARADLVGAMARRPVFESEIRDAGSEFHFVVDRGFKEPWE